MAALNGKSLLLYQVPCKEDAPTSYLSLALCTPSPRTQDQRPALLAEAPHPAGSQQPHMEERPR